MVILGVDYGLKNIGLAIATSPLAEPLTNLRVSSGVNKKLQKICLNLQVEKIVIGMSEGKIAREIHKFATQLGKELNIPIVFQDETLTTRLAAQNLSESQTKKRKRQGPKHSFAASLILQEYLDTLKDSSVI